MKNNHKSATGVLATPLIKLVDCRANEKHHQEQPKFQLTIPKGHNITNIAKYN